MGGGTNLYDDLQIGVYWLTHAFSSPYSCHQDIISDLMSVEEDVNINYYKADNYL